MTFRDERKSISINPLHMQSVQPEEEGGAGEGGKEEEQDQAKEESVRSCVKGKKRQQLKFILKYGCKFTLNELCEYALMSCCVMANDDKTQVLPCRLGFLTMNKEDQLRIPRELRALKKFVSNLPYNRKLETTLQFQLDELAIKSELRY